MAAKSVRFRARHLALSVFVCLLPVAGDGAAPSSAQTLLLADQAMNRMAMDDGNDTRAMVTYMSSDDIGYCYKNRAFCGVRDTYNKIPPGPSPGNQLSVYTEFAEITRAGDVGVTYGAWNARFSDDSKIHTSTLAYSRFVFGFSSGMWTATWSPRGAPRQNSYEYLRIWRATSPGIWRVIDGAFAVERLAAGTTQPVAVSIMQASPTWTAPGIKGATDSALHDDQVLSAFAEKHGLLSAYQLFAADDIRVLRKLGYTTAGVQNLKAVAATDDIPVRLRPMGIMVTSPDMICSYGYTYRPEDQGYLKSTGYYVHVWKPTPAGWRLALVLFNNVWQ